MCWTWNSDFPGSSSVQLLCWSNRVKTQRHCCDFFRSKVHLPPSEGQKALTPTAKDPFSRTACKCCVDQRLRGNRTVHSLISFHFLTCVKSFVCSHNCYDWSLSKNQDVCGSSECYWSLQHNDNLFWALLVSVSVVKLRSHHRQKGRQESGFLVRYGLTQVQTVCHCLECYTCLRWQGQVSCNAFCDFYMCMHSGKRSSISRCFLPHMFSEICFFNLILHSDNYLELDLFVPVLITGNISRSWESSTESFFPCSLMWICWAFAHFVGTRWLLGFQTISVMYF